MSAPLMTPEDLIALFAAKVAAPPPEASQLLVRHLTCKESVALARLVSEAMDRTQEAEVNHSRCQRSCCHRSDNDAGSGLQPGSPVALHNSNLIQP